MAKRVNADQVMKARDVDLLDYLESKGETFEKEGKYYRHTKHDSLIIRDNMYAWNSRGERGYGAINFAQMYYGMSFPQAVMDLNGKDYKTFKKERNQEEKQPYVYKKHYEVDSKKELKNYLEDERKVHPKVVNWLVKHDLIAQDQKKNIVFKWRKDGEIVGADRQGTIDMGNGRRFKGVDKHSQEHQGFHFDIGNPDKLILFESPIDALSYYSVKQNSVQNARLMSMNGLKPATMSHAVKHMLDQGYKVKNVVLAVDNDKAGREFVDQLKTTMRPNDELVKDEKAKDRFFQTDLSKTKDWNEDLKQMTKQGDQKEKAAKGKNKEPERER